MDSVVVEASHFSAGVLHLYKVSALSHLALMYIFLHHSIHILSLPVSLNVNFLADETPNKYRASLHDLFL